MIETIQTARRSNPGLYPSDSWVHDVLEPDQLVAAKTSLGRRKLGGKTVLLLWGLRVYVLLMVVLIVLQIWNALHGAA
jgi:hypothetical protein